MTTTPVKSATGREQDQLSLYWPSARIPLRDGHTLTRATTSGYSPDLVRAFGGNAFEHDAAYYIDDFSGAALWLPPDVQAREDEMIALFQRTVPEWNQAALFSVLELMDHHHPTEPHWYLPLIGVNRSALLEHALVPCDRESKLAYLESSDPRNIPLYQRHGFEVTGTIQVGRPRRSFRC